VTGGAASSIMLVTWMQFLTDKKFLVAAASRAYNLADEDLSR
jgi:hypothetical protein